MVNIILKIDLIRVKHALPITEEYCLSRQCIDIASTLINAMDNTVDPCEDFFEYACGNWNRKNIIPEDKSSFNTFEKLYDELQIILKDLLEEPIKVEDSESTMKAKVLYASCTNMSAIELVGDEPLRKVIKEIGGWPVIDKTWDERTFIMENMLQKLRGKYNARILFDCWVGPDDKNSTSNIIQLDQLELGMPSREYYQEHEYVRAYLRYMVSISQILGADNETSIQDMEEVVKFETKLANASKPQSDRHDTGSMYKKITIRQLKNKVPEFDWMTYFSSFIPFPLDENEPIVTFALDYLEDMAKIIHNTDKRVIANYMVWRLVLNYIPEMTNIYLQVMSEYKRVMQGITKEKPRWQKCVENVNNIFGMPVGAMFIKDNFKKESKDIALDMIHDIREAFNELLQENDWMDEHTRSVARDKANAMNERIGYPEFIKLRNKLDNKYKDLHFDENQYFDNVLKLDLFDATNTMKKLRQPVDKNQWEQDPAVVNAFYNPNTNDIVFPAGILQPPFYSDKFPKNRSLNYGGIGVVIGHEITHGFDDKGRQYDKHGNLKQWWNNQTIEAFRKRAQCMVVQYNNYKLEQIGLNVSFLNAVRYPELKIDGKNTQGENIADNGGLKQAYRQYNPDTNKALTEIIYILLVQNDHFDTAYKKWVAHHGEETLLPGIWCGNMRDEEALHKIRTSVHSPGPVRVLGPLSNSKILQTFIIVPLGSRMNPVEKCSVW
ncbi:hypothetical protein KUTeg_001922 [Tegillarca granosa]|uniref:Membrane metallo-endopeptidase-like 1 n=1 Tax=Tegillarca granosa TaxID=220873 RepID=A0ABQ9FVL3_TEGGR|nr:hypothetical protein KUTeg_001922 [Tegillarca granosa]